MTQESIINKKYNRQKYTQANSEIWDKLSAIKGEPFIKYRKILKKAESGQIVTDFPVEVLIKTTLNCNHFCPKCPHGIGVYPQGAKYNMSFNTLKKVLDEGKTKGLQSVVFTGGEPTMHPEITKFLDYTGKLGFPDVSLITNGSLLNNNIIDCLISNGITRMNISFDSINPETFNKVRGVDHYHRVLDNIDNFITRRKEKKSITPLLSISFVLQEENYEELDGFIQMWKNKADGGIKIYPYKNIYPIMNSDFFNTYGHGRVKIDDINQSNLPHKLSSSKPIMKGYKIECTIPWYRCHVGVNGELQACTTLGFCDHPDMVMGNIHNISFEKAWKSDAWNKLREITLSGSYDLHPVCKICQQST